MRLAIGALIAGAATVALALSLPSAEPPAERTYVGTRTCAGCHSDKFSDSSDYQGFAAFQQTMHQKIHLRPNPQTVIIDRYFAGDSVLRAYMANVPIPGKDTLLIQLSKSDDGRDYYIQMRISGGGDTLPRMKVAYTYGGNGWIQRYLVEVNGGLYVAPFQYILPGYRRRVDSSGAFYYLDMNRWLSLDSTTSQAKFFRLTSNRFRRESWERNCAPCHVTGPNLVTSVTGSDTTWSNMWVGRAQSDSARTDQNILVGCESCHGPGSEHAMTQAPGSIINPRRWANTREATDMKLDLCGNCHYRIKSTAGTHAYPYNEATGNFYVPGQPITDYIKDRFTGMNTWPDRVTSYAHHQTGQDFLRSKMYEEHVFTNGCWDCHNVHSSTAGLPYQLKENFYSLKAGEGCVRCHEEQAATRTTSTGQVINLHSKHPQSMSQCVNCHMTKTASIGFMDIPGSSGNWEFSKRLYEFSTHSFRVIPPSATRQFGSQGINIGMMNTCAESCHRNGRGSRNSNDSIPAAPTWGIHDNNPGIWNEKTDLQLADTLQYFYNQMFPEISSVADRGAAGASRLVSITPNPLRTSSRISFIVADGDRVALSIFDARGARVMTTVRSGAGEQTIEWNGTDNSGRRLPAGSYIVRLEGRGTPSEQRVVIER